MAGQTEIEHYEPEPKRVHVEVERLPEREKQEKKEIFAEFGISENLQNVAVEELSKDKKKWVDFMMKFELGFDNPIQK